MTPRAPSDLARPVAGRPAPVAAQGWAAAATVAVHLAWACWAWAAPAPWMPPPPSSHPAAVMQLVWVPSAPSPQPELLAQPPERLGLHGLPTPMPLPHDAWVPDLSAMSVSDVVQEQQLASESPDRPALALTAPDLDALSDWPNTGQAIELRLHIDEQGRVQSVDVLACAEADQAFAQALSDVLRRTPHIPARLDGLDVASVKVVRLSFGV